MTPVPVWCSPPASASCSPRTDCARWMRTTHTMPAPTAAINGSAMARTTRERYGRGYSGRSRARTLPCTAMHRAPRRIWPRSSSIWPTRASARSARFSTRKRHICPRAALPRRGVSRRPCAPGSRSMLRLPCPLQFRNRAATARPPPMDEVTRLRADGIGVASWKYWGPYLSERQWGTVREDYSRYGTAWEYFPHDHARSRAYRWGEDGIGGFSDLEQRLCLAIALWNERDPILKERLFGLTNSEGNHGEDVKELYYYLDATPCHTYLRMLYKYPQTAFPYQELLDENRRRGIGAPEYELIDTGVFDADRYFDVFIEYAQVEPGEIL